MSATSDSVPFTSLFIDGESRPASNGKTFEVRNPYTGKLVGLAASATSDDCRGAIEAAGKALVSWSRGRLTSDDWCF